MAKQFRVLQLFQKFEIFPRVLSWLDELFFNSYRPTAVDVKTLSCHLIQINVVLK